MSEPQPDGVLTQIKQYRFVRELGRGGMGTVHEAVDGRDGGRVAVKLLHPWLVAQDPTFRDRFEREAHIAALLRSPYSVRLLDFGAVNGTYFLVMEFVEGTSVSDELVQGPLDPVRALRIAIDVARALEEASTRGIVHRDIKPDNIMLTPDGRVKLTDFGIARQAGGAGLTSAGGFVGTPAYAAPEQAVGEADERSDIYSLGATLYCMLTGHPPFTGATAFELLRQHQAADVPMEPVAHLPNSITFPLRRCLEKDPRDRYQTAAELAGALERALATYLRSARTIVPGAAGVSAPPPTPSGARSVPPPPVAIPPQPAAIEPRQASSYPIAPPPPAPAVGSGFDIASTRTVEPMPVASPAIPSRRPTSGVAGRSENVAQPPPPGAFDRSQQRPGWLRRNWWKAFAFLFVLHGIPPLVVAIRDRNVWYGVLAAVYSVPFFLYAAATDDSPRWHFWMAIWLATFGFGILQVFLLPSRVTPDSFPWVLETKRLARLGRKRKIVCGIWIAFVLFMMVAGASGSSS